MGVGSSNLVQTLFLMTVVMLVPQEVIKAEELPDEENVLEKRKSGEQRVLVLFN